MNPRTRQQHGGQSMLESICNVFCFQCPAFTSTLLSGMGWIFNVVSLAGRHIRGYHDIIRWIPQHLDTLDTQKELVFYLLLPSLTYLRCASRSKVKTRTKILKTAGRHLRKGELDGVGGFFFVPTTYPLYVHLCGTT